MKLSSLIVFFALALVVVVHGQGYDDYAYGGEPTPTPPKTPPPTQKVPPPPCPPEKNCHKKPECGPCHEISISKARDGEKQCCDEFVCKPKKCKSKPPTCESHERLVLKKPASPTHCCPTWECVPKCDSKKQCHCGHTDKCKDGSAPELVEKADPKNGKCCAVYKCNNPCDGVRCKKPKCGDDEVPQCDGEGKNPEKPCCPKYKCVKKCHCPKVESCPPGWTKEKDEAKSTSCGCNWEVCKPPPCYKAKCDKVPKKCPAGEYLKVIESPGKDGQKPCCCKQECVKEECEKVVCKTKKCGKYQVPEAKSNDKLCCPVYTCRDICPKEKPDETVCKKDEIKVVSVAAHENGPGKPCAPEYKCVKKCCKSGCPKKPECPKDWTLKEKKDKKPFDCCHHYECVPPACPKCQKSKCSKNEISIVSGVSEDGCCLDYKCKSECCTTNCPPLEKCPENYKTIDSKPKKGQCCPTRTCEHPCENARCNALRCGKGTYPVVERPAGYDEKEKKYYCCPEMKCAPVCDAIKCPEKPTCNKGWSLEKLPGSRGDCCDQYKCVSPCEKSKCKDLESKISKCTKEGGRPIVTPASYPEEPCCPSFKCEPACPKTPFCAPLTCGPGYKPEVVEVAPAGSERSLPCCPKQRCVPVCHEVKCSQPSCGPNEDLILTKGSDGPKGPRCCPEYTCENKCEKKCCDDKKCPQGFERIVVEQKDWTKGKCCDEVKCKPPCEGKVCEVPKCEFGKPIMIKGANAPLEPCCPEYRCPNKCEQGGCCQNSQPKECPAISSCKPWEKASISTNADGCCPEITCKGPCEDSKKPDKIKCADDENLVLVKFGLRPQAKPCHDEYKCVSKCHLAECNRCKSQCPKGHTAVTVVKKDPKKGICCDVIRCKPKCADEKCKPKCPQGEDVVFHLPTKEDLTDCPVYGCCPKYSCIKPTCHRVACTVPSCGAGKYPAPSGKSTSDGCCPEFNCVLGPQAVIDHNCPGYSCPHGYKPRQTSADLWDALRFCPQFECVNGDEENGYLTSFVLKEYGTFE